MSMSNGFENAVMLLIFNATTFANVAVNATSSPITSIYVALHTADPGEADAQTTSEAAYGAYARVGVTRTSGGWAVTANVVNPVAPIQFPTGTSGSGTAGYFSVGRDASGTGLIFFTGTVSTPFTLGNTFAPQLTTATSISID